MAKQGIGTGSSPNDGTGDTLLTGAGKINDNFDEVYSVIGDGTTVFVGIVTQITAGTNVSISTAYGSVEVSAGTTTNIRTNSLNVSGVSTVSSLNSTGVVTATSFVGNGANLTGITTLIEAGDSISLTTDSGITTISSTELRANTLEVTGFSTFQSHVNLGAGVSITGITTSSDGFITGIATQGVQITFSGTTLTFTVAGIGSTNLTLS
tara:strand:+ start:8816 stop:9442 length:627 start_codon:yes stop_codon:yes gene_type:complete